MNDRYDAKRDAIVRAFFELRDLLGDCRDWPRFEETHQSNSQVRLSASVLMPAYVVALSRRSPSSDGRPDGGDPDRISSGEED